MHRHEILLFAAAAELANADRLTVDVSPPATAASVLRAIGQQVPELATLLPACRLAVGEAFVDADFPVTPGATLALIPPVSGG